MTIPVADTGGRDFEPVPEGIHQAVCIAVADLGAQRSTWNGEIKIVHQVWIQWEIPACRIDMEVDGQKVNKAMTIANTYTASLSQKANLRKHLEGWRGRQFTPEELQGFDLTNVVGTCCQIQVQHAHKQDKTYANVIAVVGWPPGHPKLSPESETVTYGSDDTAQFDKLPKWIREKIQGSTQASPPVPGAPVPPVQQQQPYTNPVPPAPAPGDFDDDIPF